MYIHEAINAAGVRKEVMKMNKAEQPILHNLAIKPDICGGKFFLDNFELKGVLGYELTGNGIQKKKRGS